MRYLDICIRRTLSSIKGWFSSKKGLGTTTSFDFKFSDIKPEFILQVSPKAEKKADTGSENDVKVGEDG